MEKDVRHKDNFLFTQNSLAVFDMCPLRFKKRYIDNLKWENTLNETAKKRIEMGNAFHIMAHRYFLGIESDIESTSDEEPEIFEWFKNLKNCFEIDKKKLYYPEYKLRVNSCGIKLEANYDLLIKDNNSYEIWDWKTHGNKLKNKDMEMSENFFYASKTFNCAGGGYKTRLQTMVYMVVLKEHFGLMLEREIDFKDIKMCYWQPDPPMLLEEINYTEEIHMEFKRILEEKIKVILEYDFANFNKDSHLGNCRFCEFEWLCKQTLPFKE